MSREQERARKKLEQNPIVECNKIQQKYYPALFSMFAEVKDPNQSYIDYSIKTMLGTLYYKCIGGISSMQEMTRNLMMIELWKISILFWEIQKEYLPHGVTVNELLERLDYEELEKYRKILRTL